MLARRQLRLAVVDALQSVDFIKVLTPGDWTTIPVDFQAEVKVSGLGDRKMPQGKHMPTFTTTVTIQVDGRLQATTAESAQDSIEELQELIEDAVFGSFSIVSQIQQCSDVSTKVEVSSEGKQHVAGLVMVFDFELFESYDQTEIAPQNYPALTSLKVHVDTVYPFDAMATYSSPAFPSSVKPAPRASGPDGRDEGALDITLPT